MENNKEIRQRMETYRSILLVLNWIGAVVLLVAGIVLANSRYTQSIGIGVIIGSVVIGAIGHFLINVALAIPFILLNNGDILEAIKGNKCVSSFSSNGESKSENNDSQNNIENKPIITLSNNQIKIIRLKNVVGSALLADVKVDNQSFQLENGEEKVIGIENGKHIISASFNSDHCKMEFEINNNSKVINVFTKTPIKIEEA